jgi:hypothetical protein
MISKITPEKIRNQDSNETSLIERSIPFLGGRPARDVLINSDDIINLIIATNTCSSLEEFIKIT